MLTLTFVLIIAPSNAMAMGIGEHVNWMTHLESKQADNAIAWMMLEGDRHRGTFNRLA